MILRTIAAQAVLAGASVAAITVAPATHAAPASIQISVTPPAAVDHQAQFPFLLSFG
jgi:hypothetical protein